MFGIGAGELVVIALSVFLGLAKLAAIAGLIVWGRWVARRLGTPGWRRASWMPVAAVVAQVVGVLATVGWLVRAFGGLAEVDAASRATVLARSISEAMNCVACASLIAIPLYVASVIGFAIGTAEVRRRARAG